jgi:hypothetical protein
MTEIRHHRQYEQSDEGRRTKEVIYPIHFDALWEPWNTNFLVSTTNQCSITTKDQIFQQKIKGLKEDMRCSR